MQAAEDNGGLFVGMISGTSADGIDVALVRFEDGAAPRILRARTFPLEASLRELVLRVSQADAQVHRFEPDAFDVTFSRFGVMFFADPVAAFGNIGRALKPGGRMVVECPNIQSACQTFLEDPVRNSRDDQDGQRTMWVFYGDPKWKDPLMIHRWGYTPDSLKALLSEVGLAEVRQEPAQFKLREPRDMRVVGVKP